MMTGGGTMGPVTPLIGVCEAWKKLNPWVEFVWVGTPEGPEREVLEKLGYEFISIRTAKLPRYFSVSLFSSPFVLAGSLAKAMEILKREKPDMVMSAGGYVSVPIVWTAKLLGIKTWIHQLDVRPGLANKLMRSFATKITTSWESSLSSFPKDRTKWIGSPVRESLAGVDRDGVYKTLHLDPGLPTVLVLGGGVGAGWINRAMVEIGPEISIKANVIHQTGKGKDLAELEAIGSTYHVFEFIYNMALAYAAADIVVARAGMGTIQELAFLNKPSVLIPIPNNQQEENAIALKKSGAAFIYTQDKPVGELDRLVTELLDRPEKRAELGRQIGLVLPTRGVAERIAKEADEMCQK